MPFITFYYCFGRKINNSYFLGKYIDDYISDDHMGLDTIVRPVLLTGINAFREQKGLKKIKSKDLNISVIGFSSDVGNVPSYSSKRERKTFDFYHETYDFDRCRTTFINGKKINIEGYNDDESGVSDLTSDMSSDMSSTCDNSLTEN